ncbi:MAG: zinc ribbon domain-containing protein [Methylomonas sp.]
MNKCPKCDQEIRPAEEICPHCGIVFAKYYKYHGAAPPQQQLPQVMASIEPTDGRLQTLLETDVYRQSHAAFLGRCLLLPTFLIWSWLLITPGLASNAVGESFLHNVNLPFHEAGHVIFRPFGAFITYLGGTLGQLLMPTICLFTLLLKTRDPYGAALALWWLGENFLDIAPYINDARAGQLPLLGGNFGESSPYGFHDWEYLLTESGLLKQDHLIARLSQLTGTLLMVAAMLCCGYLLIRQWRTLKSSEKG